MREPSPAFALGEAGQPQRQQQQVGVQQAMSGPAPPSPITSSSSAPSSRHKRTRRHSSRRPRRSRSHRHSRHHHSGSGGNNSGRRTEKRRRHYSSSSNAISRSSSSASSTSSVSSASSPTSTPHASLPLRKDSTRRDRSRGHHSHSRHHHQRHSRTSSRGHHHHHSRHRHHRSRKEALLHAESYSYDNTNGGAGNVGILPLDMPRADGHMSHSTSKSSSSSSNGEDGYERGLRLDPVEKDIPLSDWVCGVCSNLNSMQRNTCYRCAVSYAESQRARPCEELVLAPVPAEKVEWAVAEVVGRMAAQGSPASLGHAKALAAGGSNEAGVILAQAYSSKHKALYLRFVSVAEATRALVFCRCQLTLNENGGRGGSSNGVAANAEDEDVSALPAPAVPLTCHMTFSRANKTARVDTASLSARDMRQAMSAVLDQPKATSAGANDNNEGTSALPRELQAQTWQPPAQFASAAEEKAYLTLLSQHWAALSAAQREYYEVRVKQSLTSQANQQQQQHERSTDAKTSNKTATTSVSSGAAGKGSMSAVESLRRRMEEKKNALKKAAEDALAAAAPPPPPPAVSQAAAAAPTSNSLALLKQRLAEKKAKLAADTAATDKAASSAPAHEKAAGAETSTASAAGHEAGGLVTLYDSFPLPPRYVGWGGRQRGGDEELTQTWRMPLTIAQRVLPPALLKGQQQQR